MKLDLISRILLLDDSTTNSENFVIDNCNKGKILDFRIVERKSYEDENIKQNFLKGNGRYNYDGIMKRMCNINDNVKLNMIGNLQIINHIQIAKNRILTIIDEANDDIYIYIKLLH